MVDLHAPALLWIAGVGLLFVAFSLLRFSVNLGILERPLAQGLVWGALTGDMALALAVSVVFELLWLDLIPAGTFIPPNAAAANLAALALVHFFGCTRASEAVFPILFCLPLAWVGARLEHLQRGWQDASYNKLLHGIRSSRPEAFAPGRLVAGSMVQMGVVNFIFFCIALSALIGFFGLLRTVGLLWPAADVLQWRQLWLAASLGGLLALRTVRGYGFLAAGVAVIAVVGLAAF